MPRDTVKSLSLEVFKIQLAKACSSLVWIQQWHLSVQEIGLQPFQGPFQHERFCDFLWSHSGELSRMLLVICYFCKVVKLSFIVEYNVGLWLKRKQIQRKQIVQYSVILHWCILIIGIFTALLQCFFFFLWTTHEFQLPYCDNELLCWVLLCCRCRVP